MQFIVKYFPEITIKSKPVRRQFSQQLCNNLVKLLRPLDPDVRVVKQWDKVLVETWAAGSFGAADEEGRRVAYCHCWVMNEAGDN